MDLVLAAINRNSGRIPTLCAQVGFSATLVNPDNHTDSASGDGGLLYARPGGLLLTGNNELAGKVFVLGSNGTEFWVEERSGKDSFTYWWGHYTNLGKPCCKPIPIRPDMVLHVLGVGVYQSDFLEQPVPVMRFDNESDAYVFDMNVKTADRWITQEEVWYDRKTVLPIRVVLYDPNGRITLKAVLSDHTPVETEGTPKESWPLIARHYELSFPDTGSQISFDLYDPTLERQVKRHPPVPNVRSFDRTDPEPGSKVIQIDAGCGDSAAL